MPVRRSHLLQAVAVAALLFFPAPVAGHTASTHVKIVLSQDSCPGSEGDPDVLGCYFEQPRGGYNVFWSDHDPLTLSHELGHVYDQTSLTDPYRVEFMRLFFLKGNWEPLAAEWFAEAYARCDRHWPAETLTAYGFKPTRQQHRAACRLIWNADRNR